MAVYVRPTEQQAQEMAAMYVQGKTLQEIATKYGFSMPTVSKYVKSTGVKVAKKGRRVVKGVLTNESTPVPLPAVEEKVDEVEVSTEEDNGLFDF